MEQQHPKRKRVPEGDDEVSLPTKKQRAANEADKTAPYRPNKTYAKQKGNKLELAYGNCIVDTKAAAARMQIPHSSVCWGFVCSNKKPTKAMWRSNCTGGSGHESFDSKLHKESMKHRPTFQQIDREDAEIYRYPFRKPAVA